MVYRKVNGRPERVTIGRYPTITIKDARDEVIKINNQFRNGENPNQKRRALREGLKFSELFDKYMTLYAQIHKSSWKQDARLYRTHLTPFANKSIELLNRHEVERLHQKIGAEHGQYVANRVLALLSMVFNKAIEWGWEKANPAQNIKKFKEKSRDRFLQMDELPRFFEALATLPNETIRDYILISLLTGARRNNVQCMRWGEVSLDNRTWRIPKTKNGDAHTVPLVEEAIAILKARQAKSDSEFVFPSKTSKLGHLVEPKRSWYNLLERANLKDVRLTWGSWQAATGANLSISGKTLAHKSVNTTAIYARLNLDPVRDSMETAVSAMLKFYPQPGQNRLD
ncbi:MAG: tyrosine-type recombinase/integrase [Gammaproteobacteria bacterium]|nr:tyrosine-type recombinase/integrase [Gammaproteobacteria bacterium]